MASDTADGDAQPLARLQRLLTAAEVAMEAVAAECALPAVAAALADASRPNPASVAGELHRRVAALAGAAQRAHDALPDGQPGEARVTRQRGTVACFATLPQCVALRIFKALPVDVRARCAAVCRDWRIMLLQRSVWAHLDLSKSSGVARPVNNELLLAASARARGQLLSLNLDDALELSGEVVQQVLAQNGAAFLALSYSGKWHPVSDVDAWLAAAPNACSMCVDVTVSAGVDALRLLRKEAPYGPLELESLQLDHPADEVPFADLFAAVHGHASFQELFLRGMTLNAQALRALVDGVLAAKISFLKLSGCHMAAASVGELARVLDTKSGSALQGLLFFKKDGVDYDDVYALLDAPAGASLAAALAANNTLTTLDFSDVGLWADMDAATAVLQAVTRHPSLELLALPFNTVGGGVAHAIHAGALLAAVVAANAQALAVLDIGFTYLGDAGLTPLVDALPQNTHLRELKCSYVDMSEAFARDRFLPAIRANTSLLKLVAAGGTHVPGRAFLLEAEALVAARAAADAAAA